MSHAVVRGVPTVTQRYVDSVLRDAGSSTSLSAVLMYCLKAWPDDVMMINAATGEHVANGQMLRWAVRVARALGVGGVMGQARGALMVGSNSPALVAAQLGSLLAGVVPLGLDPCTTVFELEYFLKLQPPVVIFTDPLHQADVAAAVDLALDYAPRIVVLGDGDEWLERFAEGCSDSLEEFKPPPVSPGDTALLLPTTGSTGPAKAALLQHAALVSHLCMIWCHATTFPRPFQRAMVFSSAQWMTWWSVVTSAIVGRVTIVMTPQPLTPALVWEILDKYEVTWALMSSALAARALEQAPQSMTSLRMILCTGSAAHKRTLEALQARLPAGGVVRQGYGMTELQGFFSVPDKDTPLKSVGRPLNIFHYKLLDENHKECGPNQQGELYIKSDCVIKSYLNNEAAHRESMTSDGWLLSGDQFREDGAGNLYFIERSKFCFKVNNFQVSPEELESVIGGVAGVSLSVVCGAPGGPAALVVLSDPAITRDMIHQAVDSRLADYKRLSGGIAFVSSLPLTHNGKLHRRNCLALMEKLLEEKQLF